MLQQCSDCKAPSLPGYTRCRKHYDNHRARNKRYRQRQRMEPFQGIMPKIRMFDIECTNLKADYGFVLCASYKDVGDPNVYTRSIFDSPRFRDDPTDDKWVVENFAKDLGEADILVSWYGSKFDMPYLQTRLLGHKLNVIPPIPHIDGWRIARYKMQLSSNRLQSVLSFLELEDKTAIKPKVWIKAMSGDKDSINYIVEHCEQDVTSLEQAYHMIKPLMVNHPNINLIRAEEFDGIDRCPTCGSSNIMLHNPATIRIARVSVTERYFCKSCGSWSASAPKRYKGIRLR